MLPIKEQIIRLAIATFVGAIIGLERKYHGKPAGVRTHTIVCIISTMLTITSAYGFYSFGQIDPSRLLANILTGIGFLAGGVIYSVKEGERKSVYGLTTAAGIWGVGALGIPIGLGLYPLAILTVVCIQFILLLEGVVQKKQGGTEEEEYIEEE
ncbi:MAG: MgtC/SapB family protein [Cellulosilyticaceae bacterium]